MSRVRASVASVCLIAVVGECPSGGPGAAAAAPAADGLRSPVFLLALPLAFLSPAPPSECTTTPKSFGCCGSTTFVFVSTMIRCRSGPGRLFCSCYNAPQNQARAMR